ncbi:NfeD family protein [Frateuria hangzhouensis]|uniref:NfeD family protein n=1 Tax=Frateuria hangzhouensis TaxID=2995589 RepID=UPI002260A75F|nr:NfeD family protein [Frateuria sp. STR12]MCX7513659.1 NfeD family protein [Frateuria sp. STR12]
MFSTLAIHHLWWLLALLLIALEVALPGYFLLWIGIGAGATGVLVWLMPGMSLLAQAIAFAVLAFLSCVIYAYGLRPRLRRGDAASERLNRRGAQMVGQRYVLIEPIVHGRGKARVGDGEWLVNGPDLPLGATVEVLSVEGNTLQVRPAA